MYYLNISSQIEHGDNSQIATLKARLHKTARQSLSELCTVPKWEEGDDLAAYLANWRRFNAICMLIFSHRIPRWCRDFWPENLQEMFVELEKEVCNE